MCKEDFDDAKKAIPLNLVDISNIVVSNKVKNNNETSKYFSNKVKNNNETSKYFICYLNDIDAVNPLCIILP